MCVCVCVFVRACECVCARASVCVRTHMYNVTLYMWHSRSGGQRKIANDNYNQHLKAKALRDTYNANIEKAEKEWGRRTVTGPRLRGIQGPAVSFHLTRLPGHGCVGADSHNHLRKCF